MVPSLALSAAHILCGMLHGTLGEEGGGGRKGKGKEKGGREGGGGQERKKVRGD